MSLQWPTLDELTLVWALIALPVLVVGLKGWDPVGRWGGEGLGWRVDSRWAWFIMEVPGFVTLPAIYILSGNFHLVGNVVLVLWLAHYLHRTFVWPWLVPKRDATVSLAMCGAAVSFNLINGGLLGWFIAYAADYPAQWLTDPRFVVGNVVMLAGAGLNVWADYRLLHLRNRSRGQRVLPRGGAFELACCPNLTGEIIEWLGFALLTWSLPGSIFFIWSVANLVPRAVWRRNWYRENFSDFPANRRALLPGVL